jgi:hypothetical protein
LLLFPEWLTENNFKTSYKGLQRTHYTSKAKQGNAHKEECSTGAGDTSRLFISPKYV